MIQHDTSIRGKLYVEALDQSQTLGRETSDGNESKKDKRKRIRTHTIKYIQGVDLRVNLAKVLTISEILETANKELEALKVWKLNLESELDTTPTEINK